MMKKCIQIRQDLTLIAFCHPPEKAPSKIPEQSALGLDVGE